MHSSLRWVTVAAAAFLLVAPLGAQRIKVTTQSVPLYVTVTRCGQAPRRRPHEGRLRGLRQRQAPDDQHLRQSGHAGHRGRDARHQRQHDPRARSREGRRRSVRDAHAADRQGDGRRVQRQDRVPPRLVHRQPRSARARAQGARLRIPHALVRRAGPEHGPARPESTGARRSWCSRTATTTRARRARRASSSGRAPKK